MCALRKNYTSLSEVLTFTYPKLHTGKTWYIDFMSFDPAEGKMKRKKYMLDSIPKITERRKRAAEMIEGLLKQLRSGWSPWVSENNRRSYTLLSDAFDKYEASLSKIDRYKTRKTYQSNLNMLRRYISTLLLKPLYVYQYNTVFISDFLDWLYLDKDVSARTRNNYRGWCSSLASYFMEREYITSNPADKIKNLQALPKKRQALTATMLRRMKEYLYEKDKKFLLACMMEYYLFIRPEELSHVRLRDISIKDQSVYVSAEVSKNKRDGKVGLNEELIKLMAELEVFRHDSDCYLFGEKLHTSYTRGSSEMFRRQWNKMRKALGWSDEYQFYSLKDSGIRDLANCKGIIVARDQARHTDVGTTNRYLTGRDLPVHEETKHFKGEL